MGTVIQLVTPNDVVYRSSYKKFVNDEVALNMLSRRATADRTQSTFEALQNTPFMGWHKTYDAVYPLRDTRENQFVSSWVFDFVRGLLFLHKNESSLQVPLSTFRSGHVTLPDFKPCDLPTPPALNLQDDFPGPYWDPVLSVSLRDEAVISRLLQDMNFQWQAVLRAQYSQLTFRKLVQAVLRIMRLDFTVVEETSWRYMRGNIWVRSTDLPEWDALEDQVVTFGTLTFIAAQDLQEGISQARDLAAYHSSSSHGSLNKADNAAERLYLVTSIRDIVLCRHTGTTLEYTQPEPFLRGWNTISDRAMKLLLVALPVTIPQTSLHNLPIELQDNILTHVSEGPVEPARVGCALGLGSVFMWNDNRKSIGTEYMENSRERDTPVESQIWFGAHKTGIVYSLNPGGASAQKEVLQQSVDKLFPTLH